MSYPDWRPISLLESYSKTPTKSLKQMELFGLVAYSFLESKFRTHTKSLNDKFTYQGSAKWPSQVLFELHLLLSWSCLRHWEYQRVWTRPAVLWMVLWKSTVIYDELIILWDMQDGAWLSIKSLGKPSYYQKAGIKEQGGFWHRWLLACSNFNCKHGFC